MITVGLTTDFLNDRMGTPQYEHEGDSGMDVRWNAADGQTVKLMPGRHIMLGTGLWPSIPRGYELQVRPRSGSANAQGLSVLNSPGTIDSSYTGELMVILINASIDEEIIFNAGDKIAQIVLCPVAECAWEMSASAAFTTRGARGFGSTGN